MAEQASIAIGRYLRELRERKGLSLLDVSRLSRSCADKIDKGTLSRLEHGQQRLAMFKLIPLTRIYDVAAEVVVERMELDRQLEKLDGPRTEDKSLAELQALGREALLHNRKWEAYGYFRDALARPPDRDGTDPPGARLSMNYIAAVRALGKNRLALHELLELERTGKAGARRHCLVLDRISNCYRCCGEYERAARYAERAIDAALRQGEDRILAFAYFSRGSLALDRSDYRAAMDDLVRAFRTYRDAEGRDCLLAANPEFEVSTLLTLAECYSHLQLHRKAMRAAVTAKRISVRHKLPNGRGYSELWLGRVDENRGRPARAAQRWRAAVSIAQELHNKRLEFSAEFYAFRQALRSGDPALARALRRRLERLAPWVPRHVPLLAEFRELCQHSRPGSRPRVASAPDKAVDVATNA